MKFVFIIVFLLFIIKLVMANSLLDVKNIVKNNYSNYDWGNNIEYREPKIYNTMEECVSSYNDYKLVKKMTNIVKKKEFSEYNLIKIVSNLSSSGSLKGYPVDNIFDNSLDTAWVEDDKGSGFGKWFKIDLSLEYERKFNVQKGFYGIIIFPGYGKSEELFYDNNRLKSALLFVSVSDSNFDRNSESDLVSPNKNKNLSIFELKFEDKPKVYFFPISEPSIIGTQFEFRLYIKDVYKGKKHDDTCISEFQLVW